MIDSNAANRVVDDRNAGLFLGDNDATWQSQARKSDAHDRPDALRDDVAGGEPCLHAGRSAATLHWRCLPALRIGNSQRGTDHGLLEEAARQFERGLSWGFWQADRPVCFRAMTQARTSEVGAIRRGTSRERDNLPV